MTNIVWKPFLLCPGCGKEEFAVGHLTPESQPGEWLCEACGRYVQVTAERDGKFSISLTGHVAQPITVTLATRTVPPIIFRLNAWKYHHSAHDTPEEFAAHQRYHYEEGTCPTNCLGPTAQLEFQGDTDPHGLFKLLMMAPGHVEEVADDKKDAIQAPSPGQVAEAKKLLREFTTNFPSVKAGRISAPQFKPEGHYLTAEGYPLGTTCWFTVVEHRGYRFICCGETAAIAGERGKLLYDLIDHGATYGQITDKLKEWRPR